jgi:hypothetical protein
MSDALAALVLGSALWLMGGVGLVVSLVAGLTLFAPAAVVLIALGAGYCVVGALWSFQRANSGPGSARHPAR